VVAAVSSITLTPSTTMTCRNSFISLRATPGAASYSFNGGAWRTSSSQGVYPNATSTYTVTARWANNCETSASVVVWISYVDCTPWTTCGFYSVTNAASEGNMSVYDGIAYCASIGARLPTYSQLQCMCANKADLPGAGLYYDYYWTSSVDWQILSVYSRIDSGNCNLYDQPGVSLNPIKCIW
jgi:hypothetical protein